MFTHIKPERESEWVNSTHSHAVRKISFFRQFFFLLYFLFIKCWESVFYNPPEREKNENKNVWMRESKGGSGRGGKQKDVCAMLMMIMLTTMTMVCNLCLFVRLLCWLLFAVIFVMPAVWKTWS